LRAANCEPRAAPRHVDEPWEADPARFTVLWAAASEGAIETRFASTTDLWRRCDDAERAFLATRVGTFSPPPWLPQERGTARHALMRTTPAGDAAYLCMDSLAAVDGVDRREALAVCWNLTRRAASRAAAHAWRPRDLVVIDNWSTLHKRVPYDVRQRRLLYRLRCDGADDGEDAYLDA